MLKYSYDLIGDIAVIQLQKNSTVKEEKKAAEELLKRHKNLRITCKKILGKRTKKYRVQKIKIIKVKKGKEKTLQTIHKETNCKFKIDLNKVFFSPRLVFERERIAKKVKKNERIAVFFAGIGPFAIVIAKKSNCKEVIGIELNASAVKLFKENIELNKLKDKVKVIKGDVKKILKEKKWENYFDRIIMPLPMQSNEFLKEAIKGIKKNGVIHYYRIIEKKEGYDKAIKEIKKSTKKKKIKIIEKRKVTSYSPASDEIVIDFKAK